LVSRDFCSKKKERICLLFNLGSKAPLEYKDAVIDDPKQRRPDITLAKSWLNWTPHVNFEFL